VSVNRAITRVSRFSALVTERGSSDRDVRAARQDKSPLPWRALDWQMAVALALVAAALNLVRLPPLSQLNLYYATAVKSMTMSWSNFFFVSFDPGGFVSVDKPPLGLWTQTLSVKSFEALLIAPACIGVYALGAPLSKRRLLIHLALFLVTLTAISLCWIETVDHIPPSQRPWVDSTLTNSEVDLALNYNGLQRLVGQPEYDNKPQELSAGAGQPGPFRLLQPPLGAQASWFLPLALVGLFASRWEWGNLRWRERASRPIGQDTRQADLVFWSLWLATMLLFFSVARFFNPYYLAILTPAICALAGIGVVGLWREYLAPGWRGWLLPVAVFSTGVAHLLWLNTAPDWNPWLTPVLACAVSVATLLLVERRRASLMAGMPDLRTAREGIVRLSAALSVTLVLALAPAAWLMSSFGRNNTGWFPISGPDGAKGNAFGPAPADARLIAYLSTHHERQRMLVATVDAFDAIPIILAANEPAMAMGGYTKYDPILTTQSLAQAVANEEIRYFLLPASNLTPDQLRALYPNDPAIEGFQTQYTNALTHWVSGACQPVPPHEWSSQSAPGSLQLFDCSAHAISLRVSRSR
jgi:4-amino-4-deoxy-L-arabinose transferase-like glycosyltransferase